MIFCMLALLPLNCWTPFTTAPFNSLLGKLWLTAVSSMEKSVVSGCPRPARVLIYASMLLNLQRYLTLAVEQAWHQLTGQQSALKVPQTDSELGQTGFQYYNTSVLERTRSEEQKKLLFYELAVELHFLLWPSFTPSHFSECLYLF